VRRRWLEDEKKTGWSEPAGQARSSIGARAANSNHGVMPASLAAAPPVAILTAPDAGRRRYRRYLRFFVGWDHNSMKLTGYGQTTSGLCQAPLHILRQWIAAPCFLCSLCRPPWPCLPAGRLRRAPMAVGRRRPGAALTRRAGLLPVRPRQCPRPRPQAATA